jgi:hypothetical protein
MNYGRKSDMTTPRAWPENAREALCRSAEEAAALDRWLDELIEKPLDAAERFRIYARMSKSVATIQRFLEREGAPTRPV